MFWVQIMLFIIFELLLNSHFHQKTISEFLLITVFELLLIWWFNRGVFWIISSCKTWHFQIFLIRCFVRGVRPAGLPDRRLWEPVCQVTVLKTSIFSDWLLFFFFLFVCFAGTSLAGDSFALEKYFWRLIFIFLGTFCLFCGNQFARWQFWRFLF